MELQADELLTLSFLIRQILQNPYIQNLHVGHFLDELLLVILRNKKIVYYMENDSSKHFIHTGKNNLKLLTTILDFIY